MAIITPKTNWNGSDIVLPEDLNRIESNISELDGGGKLNERIITAGTGLTGGGALSQDRTISANFGDGVNQIPRGNHTHSDYVPDTRSVSAGTGLTGGGTLVSDRTISANFGSGYSQIPRGNHTHPYIPDGGEINVQSDSSISYDRIYTGNVPINISNYNWLLVMTSGDGGNIGLVDLKNRVVHYSNKYIQSNVSSSSNDTRWSTHPLNLNDHIAFNTSQRSGVGTETKGIRRTSTTNMQLVVEYRIESGSAMGGGRNRFYWRAW